MAEIRFRETPYAGSLISADGNVRPRIVRKMMLEDAAGEVAGVPGPAQASLLGDESSEPNASACEAATFRWGAVPFPIPPQREEDFADVVEWETGPWWPPERVERALSEMAPLHRARISAMSEAGGRRTATAYRRRRNGRSVYEVRSDGVAGCLRTARGGSSTQIVVVVEDTEVRMRWMNQREYARLQGAAYQEALDCFSDADLRTAFGDAVCVPAVRWIADHALGPLLEVPARGRSIATGGHRYPARKQGQ